MAPLRCDRTQGGTLSHLYIVLTFPAVRRTSAAGEWLSATRETVKTQPRCRFASARPGQKAQRSWRDACTGKPQILF